MVTLDKEAIARTLRELRTAKGETQEDVAKVAGVTKMAVSKYENGEMIPADDVKVLLANHFDKPIDKIFFLLKR